MANQVFANGLEIACKAAAGLSPAAFPDPCFSPYLIPYPNTTFAKDLANASTTVFITNKPIALKDKSFFATSTGNEPATNNYAKGLKTQVITGKAYFRSWSMDVFVEGYNVCRHTDDMTHNHGSDPGNTGNWKYLDSASAAKACEKDKKKVEEECGVSKKENEKFKDKQKKRNKRNKGKDGFKAAKPRNKTWKDKHCLQLMLKPTSIDEIQDKLKAYENEASEVLDDIYSVIKGQAGDAAVDYGIRAGAKHAAALGCSVFSPLGALICEAGVAIYNIADAGYTAYTTVDEMAHLVSEASAIADQVSKGNKYLKALEEYSQITDPEAKDAAKTAFWDEFRADMKDAVAENECLRARKCMLVPYQGSQKAGKHGKEKVTQGGQVAQTSSNNAAVKADDVFGKMGNASTGGCCPGQTGHHLIPSAWMKASDCGYSSSDRNAAPTVCVEGTNNTGGTHGTMHTETDRMTKRFLGKKVSIETAVKLAGRSHKNAQNKDFGSRWFGDHCNEKCIQEQLNEFYKKFECEPTVTDKSGGEGLSVDTAAASNNGGMED
ncbi:PAAR-like domain-containing protein [Marinomonas fungiae]|uniref:PAAR-like domain-containing protein n=1 Tax=Marinomonas fungiae TaxID=1137284 RepID=UPI003A8ECDC6